MSKNKPNKEIICGECNCVSLPNSGRQKYCDKCKESVQKRKSLERWYRNGRKQNEKQYSDNGTYIKKGYNQKGTNNNNYKSNIANYRKISLEVNGSECNDCGSVSNILVHHKDGDRSNNAPSNLITLCKKCHQALH